uniref:LAM_G_DOMAIN domain-containing protein n=1 Tax=Panagrellus redivivus TaxID=6233 RepID=A0A7E4VD10_PANRE
MMHVSSIMFMFCLAVGTIQGKVELKNGEVERVVFEGEELTIFAENTLDQLYPFTICFPSSTDSYPYCPSGFAGASFPIGGNEQRKLILNRKGQLLVNGVNLGLTGTVKFNEDGTLNVTVVGSESRLIVTLLNAEIYEPEKLKEEKKNKKGVFQWCHYRNHYWCCRTDTFHHRYCCDRRYLSVPS